MDISLSRLSIAETHRFLSPFSFSANDCRCPERRCQMPPLFPPLCDALQSPATGRATTAPLPFAHHRAPLPSAATKQRRSFPICETASLCDAATTTRKHRLSFSPIDHLHQALSFAQPLVTQGLRLVSPSAASSVAIASDAAASHLSAAAASFSLFQNRDDIVMPLKLSDEPPIERRQAAEFGTRFCTNRNTHEGSDSPLIQSRDVSTTQVIFQKNSKDSCNLALKLRDYDFVEQGQ